MKFETTISAIIKGVCLFEADVIAVIDHKVDRYNELEWWVDEYRVEGIRRIWDENTKKWTETRYEVAVPEKLAEVLDEFLDREKMEERVREYLVENDDRADHLRDMAMDR